MSFTRNLAIIIGCLGKIYIPVTCAFYKGYISARAQLSKICDWILRQHIWPPVLKICNRQSNFMAFEFCGFCGTKLCRNSYLTDLLPKPFDICVFHDKMKVVNTILERITWVVLEHKKVYFFFCEYTHKYSTNIR